MFEQSINLIIIIHKPYPRFVHGWNAPCIRDDKRGGSFENRACGDREKEDGSSGRCLAARRCCYRFRGELVRLEALTGNINFERESRKTVFQCTRRYGAMVCRC